jgi:catechol 2,3-dioxygenase-like lactoylglutathione lyase family enzyme
MTLRVDKVSIPVRDQEKALRFYRDVLGFEVTTDTPFGEGQRWLELRAPGQDIAIVLFTAPGHESRIGTFQHVLFTAPDVQAAYEAMKAKGVVFTLAPKREPWGISAVFQDVDGNSFSLASAS